MSALATIDATRPTRRMTHGFLAPWLVASWFLVCGLALLLGLGCASSKSAPPSEPAPPPAAGPGPIEPPAATSSTVDEAGQPAQPARPSGTGDLPSMLEQFNRAAARCRDETYRTIKAQPDRAWTEQERDDMTRDCLVRAGFERAS